MNIINNRFDSGCYYPTLPPVSKQAFDAFLKKNSPNEAEKQKMFASNLSEQQREILKARFMPIACLNELPVQIKALPQMSCEIDEWVKPLKKRNIRPSFPSQKRPRLFISSRSQVEHKPKINEELKSNPNAVTNSNLCFKISANLKSYQKNLDLLRECISELIGKVKRVKILERKINSALNSAHKDQLRQLKRKNIQIIKELKVQIKKISDGFSCSKGSSIEQAFKEQADKFLSVIPKKRRSLTFTKVYYGPL